MNRIALRIILTWVEALLYIVVPLLAMVAIVYELFAGWRLDTDTLLRLILAVVAGIAITEALARYLTLKNILTDVEKMSRLSNLPLLQSAHEYGVVDLWPRADKDHCLPGIIEAIQNAKGQLDLCGVALPSMIKEDSFRAAILEYSKRDDVRILLLDPNSYEAKRRAGIESPLGTATRHDIEATVEWLTKQMASNHRFRVHLYELPPMLGMILTNQLAFIEPYHFGRPDDIEGCIGGYVPMIKLRNCPDHGTKKNPYEFFIKHFDYLWTDTRDKRAGLRIEIMELDPHCYVRMKNRAGLNIAMTGWKLYAEDIYEFDPDFIWENEQEIIIAQASVEVPKADQVFIAETDVLGRRTTFGLMNGAGVLVAECRLQDEIQNPPLLSDF